MIMIKKIIFFMFFVIEALYLVSCIKLFIPEERIYFKRKERKYITNNEKIKLVKKDVEVSDERIKLAKENVEVPNEETKLNKKDIEISNKKIRLVKRNTEVSIEFSREIYYDIGETQYKNNYTYILNEVVNFLKDNADVFLVIEGHADALAYKSKKVNYMVSVNRALIAKNYIIKYIDENRIKTYAYSDTKPKYEEEKNKNRRVDFIIIENEKELKEYDNFYSNYMTDFLIEIGITNIQE